MPPIIGQTRINRNRIGVRPGLAPLYPTAGNEYYRQNKLDYENINSLDKNLDDGVRNYFTSQLQEHNLSKPIITPKNSTIRPSIAHSPTQPLAQSIIDQNDPNVQVNYIAKPASEIGKCEPMPKCDQGPQRYPFVSSEYNEITKEEVSFYTTDQDTSNNLYSAGGSRSLPLRSKDTIFWAYFLITAVVGFICAMILISHSNYIRNLDKHKDHPSFTIIAFGWAIALIILATSAYNIYFLIPNDRMINVANLLLGLSLVVLIIWTFSFADQQRPDIAIYWGLFFALILLVMLMYIWSISRFWALMVFIVFLWTIGTVIYMFHLKENAENVSLLQSLVEGEIVIPNT